jgi:hypothetical protein
VDITIIYVVIFFSLCFFYELPVKTNTLPTY